MSATVSAVSGQLVTLTAGWEGAFDPDKFVRGMLKWKPAGETTRRRMIVRRAANVLTVAGTTGELAPTDTVQVVLGCNHRPFADNDGDCQALHDNILNFGGDHLPAYRIAAQLQPLPRKQSPQE